MPKMRLGWYAGASTALAGAVVLSAFQQRANFYSAMVYLSQSNFCLLVLINFTLLLYGTFIYGLSKLCWGPLRTAEVEQLTERAWFAITETCLAMTIFRDELGAWFLVMFTALVTGKVWGWIGDGRVEFLEQQPPANPRLFHTRLTISLLMSFAYDLWILRYCINTVIQEARATMMIMFLFEFAVLSTTSCRCGLRYILSIIEQKMIQTQTQARLLERKQEVREERDAIIRRRQEAAAAGQSAGPEDPLPDPDDIDEMDIEVSGWATKGEWVLWLDLLTDTVKLILYITFFVLLTKFYNFPIHIMRDLLMTARDFLKRLNSVLRYRRAIQEMNRYPDATQEELDQENTCIICREDMRVWDLNANPSALDRTRPKKLPCGHILHLGCLKSWLERQQVCPTCRSPVTVDRANQPPNQNANPAPAPAQLPNHGLQAAPLGLGQQQRFARFGMNQPLLDPAAQAALNVDAYGRPINPVLPHQPPARPRDGNVRPMEEFHEMIRDEEQRRQEAEDRARRRWRGFLPSEVAPQQAREERPVPQPQASASQPPTLQGEQSQQTSNRVGQSAAAPQPVQPLQSTPSHTPSGQEAGHQAEPRMQRNPFAETSQTNPPNPVHPLSGTRSQRLRTLANMYSQAGILIRQETESLRVSTEQLQILGQLVNEFERLEGVANGTPEGHLAANSVEAQYERLYGHLPFPGVSDGRAVPSRTQSPAMTRHGATSYSAAIPSGSPDLPEGVAIPSGWTLMPLQRLDGQNHPQNSGTQRSSRAPSAGPAMSPLGEDRNSPAPASQAPTSQPATRTNVHVLERIPGTSDFRLAGAGGNGTDADSQGGRITRQQLLDRFFSGGEGALVQESGSSSRARSEASNTTAAAPSNAPAEETQSTPDASSSTAMPSWAGSSQLFAGANRNGRMESNGTAGTDRATPLSNPTTLAGQNGEGSSHSAPTATTASQAEDSKGGKSVGKAVTLEEVSDEDEE